MAPRAFLPLRALCALTIGLAVSAAAQENVADLFFDTVDVSVVNIEVLVTDEEGLPVTDLSRDDFEVLEDGIPVEVTNFFAVENRQAVPPSGGGLELEIQPAPETRRLNLVIFIDNLNMRPQNRNPIFENLRSFLREKLDSRDRVMLVSMNDTVEVVQGFTNDVDLLFAALDQLQKVVGGFVRLDAEHSLLLHRMQTATLPPRPISIVEDPTRFLSAILEAERLATDVERLAGRRLRQVRGTTEALARFTHSLAGLRGRKAILYVSDGLPIQPSESLAQGWLNKFDSWIMSESADDANDELRDMQRLLSSSEYDARNFFDRLVEHASANRVVFYPLANGGRMARTGASAEFGSSSTSSGRGAVSADVVAMEQVGLESPLIHMADGTGGLAFTRTTNIGGLLTKMVQDFDSFYSLGYAPGREADDAFHKVEVRLRREGLQVRHLGGYRERDPVSHLQDLTLSALHYGLTDNVLDIELDPGEQEASKGDRFRVPVMLKVPIGKLLLLPREATHSGRLSVVVVVRDEKSGGVSEPQRIEVPIDVPNAQIFEAAGQKAAYPIQLDMKKGRKRISVGVRDHLARIDATANLELTVGRGTSGG